MYLSSPVTILLCVAPPRIFKEVAESEEPFLLYNNLNPLIMPCLEFTGGKSQDAVIPVEKLAETLNFVGAWEGAAIEQKSCTRHFQ